MLNTHVSDSARTAFAMDYVSSIEKDLTVDLRREVLERSMKSAPETSCDRVLATLSITYQESIDRVQPVDAAEELDEGDLDEVDSERSEVEEPISRATWASSTAKISKKKMSSLIGKNVYTIGKEKLLEKDIVAVRLEAERRREKKSRVRGCILRNILECINGVTFERPPHSDIIPTWQQFVRGRQNNLGIK